MSNIKLPAKMKNLKRLIQFVSGFAMAEGFSEKRIREIELATEEALVNIFKHAYPAEMTGEVELRCRMDEASGLIIEILDTGKPFDIQSVSEPDLSAKISDREIGGLGVYFIRKMADEFHYRRDGEHNILTLIVHKI